MKRKKFKADVYLPLSMIVISILTLFYVCSGETIKYEEKVENTGLVIKHRVVKPYGNRQWKDSNKSYFSVETDNGEILLDEKEGGGTPWVYNDLVIITGTKYFFCVRDGKITGHEWRGDVSHMKSVNDDIIELESRTNKRIFFDCSTRKLLKEKPQKKSAII